MSTSIEWTATVHPDGTVTPGKTWNPVTGCTKVSAGCKHCYAEVIADRFWKTQYPPIRTVEPNRVGTLIACGTEKEIRLSHLVSGLIVSCGCVMRASRFGRRRHGPVEASPRNYPRIGSRRIHQMRAERALGRPLPPGAQVHHADGTRGTDSTLVICQDDAYHKLLHARARVRAAGGDPNHECLCKSCKKLTPSVGRLGGRAERCPPCNRAHTARRQGGHDAR